MIRELAVLWRENIWRCLDCQYLYRVIGSGGAMWRNGNSHCGLFAKEGRAVGLCWHLRSASSGAALMPANGLYANRDGPLSCLCPIGMI